MRQFGIILYRTEKEAEFVKIFEEALAEAKDAGWLRKRGEQTARALILVVKKGMPVDGQKLGDITALEKKSPSGKKVSEKLKFTISQVVDDAFKSYRGFDDFLLLLTEKLSYADSQARSYLRDDELILDSIDIGIVLGPILDVDITDSLDRLYPPVKKAGP